MKHVCLWGTLACAALPLRAADLGDVPGQDPGELELLYGSLKADGQEAPVWLLEKLFPGSTLGAPGGSDGSRQGGVSPATAVLIPGLPYSDSGSTSRTSGAQHSVGAELFTAPTLCPQVGAWAAGGARDRSYKLVLSQPSELVIDLCASGYDTAVGVFVDAGGTVGECVARDDDGCGASYRSIINTCLLPAGSYFIVVDGYGNSTGSYQLTITGTCDNPGCLPGFDAAFELEGNGMDSNGGCNMDIPGFEPLSPGVALCGTTWAAEGNRDTDWFEVQLTGSSILHVTLATACVPMNLVLVDDQCPTPAQLTYVAVGANATGSLTSGCLAAGTYRLVAVPQGTSGFAPQDLHHYGLLLTTEACHLPCDDPAPLACGAVVDAPAPTANNFVAGSPSCTGYSHNGYDHEYGLTITQECDVVITMDNYGTRDAALLLRTDCQDANSCIAGADATVGGEPEVLNVHLLPGLYYVIADFYNTNQGEAYLLTVECSGGVVSADDQPEDFALGQNVPNPFNPTTRIDFSLGATSEASLKVFDVAGREVATVVSGLLEAGRHTVHFDASQLGSGVYFYTLQANGTVETRKMVLLK
ncbi:MAG: T9SS type A sorting domain-containing protein [Candidatus Delongbacteria bacterium]